MNQKYNDAKKYFITNNVNIGSVLLCNDFEYENLVFVNKETLYVFKNKAGLQETVNNYLLDDLKVSANKFVNSVKELENKRFVF